MEVSEKANPSFEKKTSNALKADYAIYRVTLNPNKESPCGTLSVPVPKLDNGVVLVPVSLSLIFELKIIGHASNYNVNDVSRALVDRLTVKFAVETGQLFKLYEDLFSTDNERASML